MKQKYFWKVTDYDLESAWANNRRLCVKYKINKLVFPKVKGTKLSVFNNLKNAENFMQACGNRIFKCIVKNPKLRKTMISSGRLFNYDIKCIKLFWLKKKNFILSMDIIPTPEGTYACDAVKLIKEVE